MQRLKNLTSGQCADTVLRTLFLERLSDSVRGILAANDTADLAQLALQADKIMDFTKGIPRVDAVSSPSTQQECSAEVVELRHRVEELSRQGKIILQIAGRNVVHTRARVIVHEAHPDSGKRQCVITTQNLVEMLRSVDSRVPGLVRFRRRETKSAKPHRGKRGGLSDGTTPHNY